VLSLKVDLPIEQHQAVEVTAASKHNRTPITAIAAVGAAIRHMLLFAEADHSVAAVAAADVNFSLIEKHTRLIVRRVQKLLEGAQARVDWIRLAAAIAFVEVLATFYA